MTRRVERRLKRLARLTELVYRREAVNAAELAQSHDALVAGAQDACAVMDEADSPSFLIELALARAARLRRRVKAAQDELDAQLAVAVEALARFKGAETLAESSAETNARGEQQRSLEEAIGNGGAPRATRLEQAAIARVR